MEILFTLSNRRYFKAVEGGSENGSGRIVGFSCWNAPERDEKDGEGVVMPQLPGFVDQKVFDEIEEKFKEAKGRIVGGRGDFWCKLPLQSPSFSFPFLSSKSSSTLSPD